MRKREGGREGWREEKESGEKEREGGMGTWLSKIGKIENLFQKGTPSFLL